MSRVNPKEDRIEYFSSKQSALIDEPSGTISLANLRSIKRFDDNSFNIDGGPDGVYLLRTDSQAQLTCWMNEIDSYIRARQVSNFKSFLFFWLVITNFLIFLYILVCIGV